MMKAHPGDWPDLLVSSTEDDSDVRTGEFI